MSRFHCGLSYTVAAVVRICSQTLSTVCDAPDQLTDESYQSHLHDGDRRIPTLAIGRHRVLHPAPTATHDVEKYADQQESCHRLIAFLVPSRRLIVFAFLHATARLMLEERLRSVRCMTYCREESALSWCTCYRDDSVGDFRLLV